ncbi:conserved hypothetical protein [Roseovarius sp. EC-HK134]|uniref:DUF3726 domain-containing protein n=1 Tax=Roseovarius TaxID=74030 RepID=UPI00125A3E07|nr:MULTISPECIES: DUF3726 domain-containing protein [unclassified Roseovarius]VVT24472.1 conserved hypothetical protein [Roseovarius sp. EC-SD190]VVT24704.1 conserved hypothetical protein [Roseovarius sp. EC-HK134]
MTECAQDPTRAGSEPPDWAREVMQLSLSEITALATKAARGAGLSWGEAEEAGWACGWLARAGLPGTAMLLRVLERRDATCPLLKGIVLMDHAGLPEGPCALPVTLQDVVEPLLLVPFLARVAERLGAPVDLDLGSQTICLTGSEPVPDLSAMREAGDRSGAEVTISLAKSSAAAAPGQFDGRIDRDVWTTLDGLALLTTVPASDVSRQRAGAQSSDND